MYINDLATVDFGIGHFSSLNFQINNATTEELAEALLKIKSCQALTIQSTTLQLLQGSLLHIEKLSSITLQMPQLQQIEGDFFPKSLTRCRINCGQLTEIPKELFDAPNLNEISIDALSSRLEIEN